MASDQRSRAVDRQYLRIGLRGMLATTPSYDSFKLESSGWGFDKSAGLSLHFFLLKSLSISSGMRYSATSIGSKSDVTFRNLEVPFSTAVHFAREDAAVSGYFGVGVSYLQPVRGYVNKTVAQQGPFSIPTNDLVAGLALSVFSGISMYVFERYIYVSIEFGFTYSERALSIITRDITLGFEIGARIF